MGKYLYKLEKKKIDADPQGDLTTYMGFYEQDNLPVTISTLIERQISDHEVKPQQAVLKHKEDR